MAVKHRSAKHLAPNLLPDDSLTDYAFFYNSNNIMREAFNGISLPILVNTRTRSVTLANEVPPATTHPQEDY